MVQTYYNYYFAPCLQIEIKVMTRKKITFFRFIYFSKSCGKMPTANPFISMVKAGHKLATPPYILITKGKKIQSQIRLCRLQFRVLICHKHVNTLDGPNY